MGLSRSFCNILGRLVAVSMAGMILKEGLRVCKADTFWRRVPGSVNRTDGEKASSMPRPISLAHVKIVHKGLKGRCFLLLWMLRDLRLIELARDKTLVVQ